MKDKIISVRIMPNGYGKASEEVRNYILNLHDEIVKLQQENERLKKALNCKEYFSSTMPEDTEFVILTKNNYDRQQKRYSIRIDRLQITL